MLHPDITTSGARGREPEHALEEAMALARPLPELDLKGGNVVRLSNPHPGMLFGKGKLAELEQLVENHGVKLLLIDGPVTPVQQRNIEKRLNVKLLDRTGLILEIFSDRAATREVYYRWKWRHSVISARDWFVPGPTLSVSAAGLGLLEDRVRRKSKPTGAP